MALPNELVYVSPLNEKFVLPSAEKRCKWRDSLGKDVPSPHSKQDWRTNYKVYPDILTMIGNTPLVRLNKIPGQYGLKCNVYAKCEFLNPGGSIKDRMAKRIFEDCERQGLIKPGMTIIEPSSGNTGIAVALISAIKGYKCIIVMSEKMSFEKEAVITSLGATLVRTPVTADSSSPDGLFGTACRLHQEIPNSFILDQFSNPGNPLTHYDTTAEEILDQLDHKVDMILFGGGTGGTITGIGRKFREVSPNTKIIGFDPEGSHFAYPESLNKTDVTFWEVEGLGYEFVPTALDQHVCDYWVKTTDLEALPMARKLMKEEGLLVGTSSGAAVAAAMKVAKDLKEGQNLVVILPDSIRNYMTKFVSDQWMDAKGYWPCVNRNNLWWWDHKVSQMQLKKPLTMACSTPAKKAIETLKAQNAASAVVLNPEGSLLGTVSYQQLASKFLAGTLLPKDPVSKCTNRILPKVDKESILGRISRILEKDSFAVITETSGAGPNKKEIPIGVIDLDDLLAYTAKH